MKPKRIYVSGLPRSGSTLICQLLAQHEDVSCDGMTSPLFGLVEGIRKHLSIDDTFLSRLDDSFQTTYSRAESVYQGVLSGWLDHHHDLSFTVDKSRGWIRSIEMLSRIDPNFKMIVCIRELGQLLGSIEHAHKKTYLLGYRDGLSHHSADLRAMSLFDQSGVVGGPLKAIKDFSQEVNDAEISSRVYYVAYEALVTNPVETMRRVHQFLGLKGVDIDPDNLRVFPGESDSHYGMKWPHKTYGKIMPLRNHATLPEIQKTLIERYDWYYRSFYSDFLL